MTNQKSRKFNKYFLAVVACMFLTGCTSGSISNPKPVAPSAQEDLPVFVALGDFGTGDSNQQHVAESISRIKPEWFVSLGDNVYSKESYQKLVGHYYGQFLAKSKFLPATGNHDYKEGINRYDSFFGSSENSRYYKTSVASDIDFFILDSQLALESSDSMDAQKEWLEKETRLSQAKYKFVVLHHPPFSSGAEHGSNPEFQWNFSAMGITAVFSGHEHLYERVFINGVLYVISGAGGRSLYHCGEAISPESICFDDTFGALYVSRLGDSLIGKFISSSGDVVDTFEIN